MPAAKVSGCNSLSRYVWSYVGYVSCFWRSSNCVPLAFVVRFFAGGTSGNASGSLRQVSWDAGSGFSLRVFGKPNLSKRKLLVRCKLHD